MAKYIFILGRNHELSLVELISYLQKENIQHKLEPTSEVLITNLKGFNPKKAMQHLGGTIKIGEAISDEVYTGTKNKITFTVSRYKADPTKVNAFFKKQFKELGVKATQRYTKSKTITPTKTSNVDIEYIAYKDDLYKVVAASNPKEYRERDEKRPAFDHLKTISIRLAKILINLAQPKKEILDPFCGTATILQEALLMNYTVKGIDTHTSDANKNLRWLQKKYPSIKNKWQLFQGDATRLSKRVKSIECAVTEPYLGPYNKKPPTIKEVKATAQQLTKLYAKVLQELHKVVKGKVVIIFPNLLTKERKTITLHMDTIIEKAGFKLSFPSKQVAMPILYTERKNNIERYIYILEKI